MLAVLMYILPTLMPIWLESEMNLRKNSTII